MKMRQVVMSAAFAAGWIVLTPGHVFAHCDGLDGPVVKAAQAALDTREVARVLIWVSKEDEPEMRAAFDRALTVRAIGPQAKELADQFFFETVVRLHRVREGASYTGLKPAGRDLGPAIPAADKALAERSPEPVLDVLAGLMEHELRARYEDAARAADFRTGDVTAGREYVRAYVAFVQYVERLYEAIGTPAHGHFTETTAPPRVNHQR